MLTLIMALFIIAFIVVVKLAVKYPKKSGYYTVHELFVGLAWTFGIIAISLGIAVASLAVQVATQDSIDEKIAFYEEENVKIEEGLEGIVQVYMAQDPEAYKNVELDSNAVELASYLPDLSQDSYVSGQLYDYRENENQITKLKKQKVNMPKKEWLVYFNK